MDTWREQVSEDTIIMIDTLIELEKEIKEMTERQIKYFNTTIVSTILLLIYVLIYISSQSEGDLIQTVSVFISNYIHIALLLIPLVLYVLYLNSQSKIHSKKQLLERLRLEVIDHLKSPWFQNDYSSIRDEISKDLESNNINVRFKSTS